MLAAQAELRRADVDTEQVVERLRLVERGPLARRFLGNPLYADVLARLVSQTAPSRRERIELQRDLEGLAVFGHVLSRTRKRDVHEEQPERRARVWPCQNVSADESEFYREVTRLCRDAYGQRNDGRGASFGIIQAQRQMASCMVAMTEYIEQRLAAIDDDASESGDAEGGNDESSPAIQPDWGALGDLEAWRRGNAFPTLCYRQVRLSSRRHVTRTNLLRSSVRPLWFRSVEHQQPRLCRAFP